MKLKMLLLCAALLLVPASLSPRKAVAQEWAEPATECLSEFYDSTFHWLTYHNSCNRGITVAIINRDGSGVGGLDLGPGRSGGTGKSRSEVAAVGGVEAYACPAGYMAVDTDGSVVSEPVSEFRCKRR